ncbi:MAG: 3-hydroxyacyl-CoA dehydrogenase NAD-binding domain-containing protein [Pseudomonadota bacterium]
MQTIALLGGGTMGHGIAQVLAIHGHPVRLYDPSPQVLEAVPGRIAQNLEPFLALGLHTPQEAQACLANLTLCPDLAQACQGAQVVIEAVPEDLKLKQRLLAQAQAQAQAGALLCSNTSALSITAMARDLADPGRLVGTHFWNPPQVIPCVEIVRGQKTSPQALAEATDLVTRVGKEPVQVLREVPGFLGNRLQHALQREALYLVEQGIASAEDVDRVVKYGFGLRYALMGPLERADLGGLDITHAVQATVLPDLDNRVTQSELLRQRVEAGQLGVKTGQGFYQWTPQRRRQRLAGRDLALLSVIKLVRELESQPEEGA